MKFIVTASLEAEALDGWVVPFHEGEFAGPGASIDARFGGVMSAAFESKEFEGKASSTLWIRPYGEGAAVRRLIAVGLGKRARATADRIGRAFAVGVNALRDAGCRRVGLLLPETDDVALLAQRVTEAVMVGAHQFTKYKSVGDDAPKAVADVVIQAPDSARDAVKRGALIAGAVNFCRDVANEPPQIATPAHVASIAEGLAGDRLEVGVLDERILAEMGMNAILAVGQGSANPPRIVTLHYKGAGADAPLYAVVGKGVTFDSGGLSIKPAGSMEDMKFDKCGACAVLGVMKAVSDLGLAVNVLGVLGLAENLPGPTAYRPGDIVRAGSGKTIEVLNTDAEGRVVLADALYHAGSFRPVEMVDLATLTGACVVALGDVCAAVLGNDPDIIDALRASGERTGERVWELPLWPEYDEKVKSDVADVKNIGERAGGMSVAGTIAGASFLKMFVPDSCKWGHLDIAGMANGGKKPYRSAGATGYGVRLVVDWLSSKAQP